MQPGEFPDIWYITLAVTGGPNLLTRPRYAGILSKHLNAAHEQQHIITRSHMLLPDQLLLLVQPFNTPLSTWLQRFTINTATEICEALRTDNQLQRQEWYSFFLCRNGQPAAAFWSSIEQLAVKGVSHYDELEGAMLLAPVKAGYVRDVDHYAYTWYNNRSGIKYKQLGE